MPKYYNPYHPTDRRKMVLSQDQMELNAKFIYDYMHTKYGWTLTAICGMLGNIEAESTMNPARPQDNAVNNGWYPSCPGYRGDAPNPTTTWYGYGLFQVTPYMALEGKRYNPYNFGNWAYSNGYTFSHSSGGSGGEMEVQLDWLMSGNPEKAFYNTAQPNNNQQKWYADSRSPIKGISTPSLYGKLTQSPELCAEVFYWNLERSGALSVGNRPSMARKWYSFLSSYTPSPPEPEPPTPKPPSKSKTNFIIIAYGSGLLK